MNDLEDVYDLAALTDSQFDMLNLTMGQKNKLYPVVKYCRKFNEFPDKKLMWHEIIIPGNDDVLDSSSSSMKPKSTSVSNADDDGVISFREKKTDKLNSYSGDSLEWDG